MAVGEHFFCSFSVAAVRGDIRPRFHCVNTFHWRVPSCPGEGLFLLKYL